MPAKRATSAVGRYGKSTATYPPPPTPPPGNFAAIFEPTRRQGDDGDTSLRRTRQSDFKFFTLNFTLSREFHPFKNRALLERSRAASARISITAGRNR